MYSSSINQAMVFIQSGYHQELEKALEVKDVDSRIKSLKGVITHIKENKTILDNNSTKFHDKKLKDLNSQASSALEEVKSALQDILPPTSTSRSQSHSSSSTTESTSSSEERVVTREELKEKLKGAISSFHNAIEQQKIFPGREDEVKYAYKHLNLIQENPKGFFNASGRSNTFKMIEMLENQLEKVLKK